MKVYLAGLGTAVPPYAAGQSEVRSIVESMFTDLPEKLRKVLETFQHDHIQRRYFVRPPEWYAEERGFGAMNDVFLEEATRLGATAAKRALADAGLQPTDVTTIVVATSTGMAVPSLDIRIAQALSMSTSVARLPIVGLGCAAGVSGLSRAAEICRGIQGRTVLFVAVETCSVTFQRNDMSKSNLVGTSIFADGAAAVVITSEVGEPGALEIAEGTSNTFQDTYDIMGWDVVDAGLKVRFSRDIPSFVEQHLGPVLSDTMTRWNINLPENMALVPHPGGAKVIDAYRRILPSMSEYDERVARRILAEYGNMSSPTVLFVLDAARRAWTSNIRDVVLVALGPGFSAELLHLRRT